MAQIKNEDIKLSYVRNVHFMEKMINQEDIVRFGYDNIMASSNPNTLKSTFSGRAICK